MSKQVFINLPVADLAKSIAFFEALGFQRNPQMSDESGAGIVVSELMRTVAASVTLSTAALNATSFAFEGALNPLSLRTNCNAEARISSPVAGGSKL